MMRKSGRLKLLEGNRGKKPIPTEPQFTAGCPPQPRGLPPAARCAWVAITAELDRFGLIAQVDSFALEGACVAYAHARWADRRIADAQRQLANPELKGKKRSSLLYLLSIQNAASRKAWQQFKSFCTEFGLTPASRSKLAVGLTGTEVDLESEALLG